MQPVEHGAAIKRLLPWMVAVAFFMESLDTTILNTALPAIAGGLHVSPLSMKSALTSYTLSLAVFIPLSGWVADRYGTRLVFSTAILVFTAGSFLCGISNDLHVMVAYRILQGAGGAMMVPVGRLVMVRTFEKPELVAAMTFVAIPGLIGPMIGPLAGGIIVAFFHWRVIFFVNLPIGLAGLYFVSRHFPNYRARAWDKLDFVGLALFSSGVALLSYVLEVFGEHTLSAREITGLVAVSLLLLLAYARHAATFPRPLLRLMLLRVRTLRVAVSGSFITRLGAGGTPFLLPLLYQVGLGYTPVQSGLLLLPQSLSAIGSRVFIPRILTRFGYRQVLLSNTIALGSMILLFATVGERTPVAVIVLQAVGFGFFSSFQYAGMNTLAYADVADGDTSMASTIVSTIQQMSMSFGVATASLTTALFIPDRFHSTAPQMIHGIHKSFLVLGALTILSSFVFRVLRKDDGDNVSRHKGSAIGATVDHPVTS
jgi:EmrB/QacA subfamily drug resistance transporter